MTALHDALRKLNEIELSAADIRTLIVALLDRLNTVARLEELRRVG